MYDAVVIGAGPAGCVVARRLADDGQAVALIEAGPAGALLPPQLAGLDVAAASDSRDHLWNYELGYATLGSPRSTSPRSFPYRQGRVVGGSSAVNGLVMAPGDDADYDRWSTLHLCRGWAAPDMAPWLRKVAAKLDISYARPGPLTSAVITASGIAAPGASATSLVANSGGWLRAAIAASNGRRRTAFNLMLEERVATCALDSPPASGVALFVDCHVARILPKPKGVTVELAGGSKFQGRRVIVTAGPLGTPLLLSRSGCDHEGLGRAVRDHPSFVFPVSWKTASERWPSGPISHVLRWSSGLSEALDLQAMVMDKVATLNGVNLGVVIVSLMTPLSSGQIGFDGAVGAVKSPLTGSRNCLQIPNDRARFRQGVRTMASHLQRLRGVDGCEVEEVLIDDDGTPVELLERMSDEDLDRWLCSHPGPVAHLVGAAAMGPDAATVASSNPGQFGAVTGMQNVFVADTSLFPDLLSGGLQLSAMAVAERIAADLVDNL